MSNSSNHARKRGAVKLETLQHIENLVGGVVCALLHLPAKLISKPERLDPTAVKKLLVVKFFGIGSLVLATPFFAAARKLFPNAEIHLMTLSSNREICSMIPDLDHVHYVDLGRTPFQAIWAYIRSLFTAYRNHYDVLIDMEFYTRASAVLSLASWAPVRIGFHSRGVYRGDIQSHRVPFNAYWHVTKNFLGLLEPFGLDISESDARPHIDLPEGLGDNAREAVDSLGVHKDRYIVINVNAGELAYERRWFPERFGELAAKCSQDFDVACVFIGAPSEHDYVQAVVDDAAKRGGRGLNVAGRLNLKETAQVCRDARLVITNDSGPLHVAAATGVPVAGFFGPETPVLYGPVGDNNLVFHNDLACSPCINIEQGKHMKCWHDTPICQEMTSVDQALQAIQIQYGHILTPK